MWHVGWLSLNLVGSKGEADRKRIGRSYPQHLSTSQILADFLFGDFVLIFGKRLGLQKKIAWTQVKVRNLFQLEADASGVSALRIEQCKANGLLFSQENSPFGSFFDPKSQNFREAWCYSNIACQYWQFSQTEGCLVDAPMLSKTFVPYPLTTAALSSGTSEAHNIIAGLGCSQKKKPPEH